LRDKHIHIAEDSALLKVIYQLVEHNLVYDQKKFNILLWTKFIVYFSLSLLSYLLLFKILNPTLFIICFVIYGFVSMLFAFNFSHDFSHNTIFKSKKLNNYCFIGIYALVGAHGESWKKRHVNSHHYAPNVDGYDSDLKISKLIRVIPNSKHFWFHKYQHIYAPVAYTSYSLFWIFIKDFVILFSGDEYSKNKNFKYHATFFFQKLFYITVILALPLLFAAQEWYVVLSGFILMHLSQSLLLLFTFFMTHHVEKTEYPTTDKNGFIRTSWLMNQIKSSNDMYPFSETANFIFGGFNNHIAHHLFPHIHHIYYPKLNQILYFVLQQHDVVPNQTSYWGGIVSHLMLLKRMSVK
jgi:linoleoyl-CoA desaturase